MKNILLISVLFLMYNNKIYTQVNIDMNSVQKNKTIDNDEKTLQNKLKLLTNKIKEYKDETEFSKPYNIDELESKVNKYLKEVKSQIELVKNKSINVVKYENELIKLEEEFEQIKKNYLSKSTNKNSKKQELDNVFIHLKNLNHYNVSNSLENANFMYNDLKNIEIKIFSDMDNWLIEKQKEGANINFYKIQWEVFKKDFNEPHKLLEGWAVEQQIFLNNMNNIDNDELLKYQTWFKSALGVSEYFKEYFKLNTTCFSANKQLSANLAKLENHINLKLSSIYVSEFHKKNINKAYFSSTLIPIKTATASDYKTEIKAEEGIQTSVFLSDVLKKYCKDNGNFSLNIFAGLGIEKSNEDALGCFNYPIRVFKISQDQLNNAAFNFTLLPTESNFDDRNIHKYTYIIDYILNLGVGKHELLIKMNFNNSAVNWYGTVIKESIIINIDENSISKLKLLKIKIIDKIIDKTELPAKGIANSNYEQLGRDLAKSKGINPTKCYIDGTDYAIYKSPIWPYPPVNRQIGGIFTYKDENGDCRYQPFLIIEYYNSEGKYANAETMILDTPVRIRCNKI